MTTVPQTFDEVLAGDRLAPSDRNHKVATPVIWKQVLRT